MAKKETAPKATKSPSAKATADKETKKTAKAAPKTAAKATVPKKVAAKATVKDAPKASVSAKASVDAKAMSDKTSDKEAKKAVAPKAVPKKAEAPKASAKKAAPKKAVAKKPAKKSTGGKPVGHGVGRRKKSIARVWLRRGKGTITINGRSFKEYFDTEITRLSASTPMRLVDEAQKYDVEANIHGGGLWGQADALKLGISRALLKINEGLRPELRKLGLLTVDARVKERKKPGQPGARRKFQFVKR